MHTLKQSLPTTGSHPILDELRSSLYHALTILNEKWEEVSLSVTAPSFSSTKGTERSFRVETPTERIVQIQFGVYPLGPGTYEVYISLADGPTRRLTYDSNRGDTTDAEQAWLGQTATIALMEEIEPRLSRIESPPPEPSPDASVPQLDIECDGTIRNLNPAARTIIDVSGDSCEAPSFFTYVHGRNLRQVIRDLTRMEQGTIQRARWLLRLQTGEPRERWYRGRATSQLDSKGTVRLRLHPLSPPKTPPSEGDAAPAEHRKADRT
ncbi:hypothetical protein BSZ35_06715 [Salinibacter sp. 10B]|uniref:hypothetical protein n=1 Tax=Salinibacter sp. 10B TaxID=1923971 RepID=UPI000CF4E114|nr:hypothetical protein [Salinibacter sp. 10B]PQJ34332.1 hypothetical protein BSZ35_06715 [Salinibacter sp. 10B]